MKVYLLSLFIVGCWGIQWKQINDFKERLKEYSETAVDTISSIENIIETFEKQSEMFLNNTYSNNPAVKRVSSMKLSDDKCFRNFIDEENFKSSFQIQLYQLQIPLRNRIADIREKLNNVNISIDIYQGIADSKLRSCKSPSGNCLEETNEWLESTIDSLSCAIYPNCSKHSIGKRSTCSQVEFMCKNHQCIDNYLFCDGQCDCLGPYDCYDEPAGCVRDCFEFRCSETYRCISLSKKCNGIDDCGDGSDEDGCPLLTHRTFTTSTTSTTSTTTTTSSNSIPSYAHVNCSIETGDFLCDSNKCIGLELVCDGYNDCGDWSDEGDLCNDQQCSPECSKKGGVCFTEPKGSKCLYECPPGTYETSKGCSRFPEAPLPTLLQVLEDTPRLIARYTARLKYLKTKTIMAISKALREVVRCKKDEFSLLSKIINFSKMISDEGRSSRVMVEDDSAIPGASDSAIPGASDSAIPGASDSAIPGASDSAIPGASDSAIPDASGNVFPGIDIRLGG